MTVRRSLSSQRISPTDDCRKPFVGPTRQATRNLPHSRFLSREVGPEGHRRRDLESAQMDFALWTCGDGVSRHFRTDCHHLPTPTISRNTSPAVSSSSFLAPATSTPSIPPAAAWSSRKRPKLPQIVCPFNLFNRRLIQERRPVFRRKPLT